MQTQPGSHPRLYEWYSTADVISFFGRQDEIQRLCDDQWLIFSAFAACLANIGESPKSSHFEKASIFCWVAERLFDVSDKSFASFVPVQAVGSSQKSFPIHLFVRPRQAEKYLYAGQLEPCRRAEMPGGRSYGMAFFKLNPALPSDVWVRLGGLRLGNLDFAMVDQALDRLQRPTTAEVRFGILPATGQLLARADRARRWHRRRRDWKHAVTAAAAMVVPLGRKAHGGDERSKYSARATRS
jgi:hypothetical protein